MQSRQTVFIVGTGIETNPWPPIVDAINEYDPDAKLNQANAAVEANFWLAKHVAIRRMLVSADYDGHDDADELAGVRAKGAADDLALKQAMARHLTRATETGATQLRPEFAEAMQSHDWGPTLFLTTNWDLLLDPQPASHVLHIHGETRDPAHMMLPSEITGERFRSAESLSYLKLRVGATWQNIGRGTSLCIYGLSLDPLDAQLSYVLHIGITEAKGLDEIVVINTQREREWA